jgi:hypothetical protein
VKKYTTLLLSAAIMPTPTVTPHAQVQPGPNLTPNGMPYTYSPRYGVFPRRPPSFAAPVAIEEPPPPPPIMAPPPPPPVGAPPALPPPPQPLGWVFTRYTVCLEPRSCPVVFVSVDADALNVRDQGGHPFMAVVNGTPLAVLTRQGQWTLVAPACDLTPTFLTSWTNGVPLSRCWVY